jgi:hypothetical protein
MHSKHLKLSAWLIVLWLISLQIMAPFVHAHMEKNGIEHASVMHLHTAASFAHDAHDTNPVLENPHGPHQIVSIAQGILNKIDLADGLDLLFFVFAAMSVVLIIVFVGASPYQDRSFPARRYRSPQPHAPPTF